MTPPRVTKYWKALKEKVFHFYSNGEMKCGCCGEDNFKFLCLDHVNGDGATQRKKIGRGQCATMNWIKINNYPSGFQVLCHNCNHGKKAYGVCPHNTEI